MSQFKLFSAALLTLNFDPDLSKVNSRLKFEPNFVKYKLIVFEILNRPYTNERKNQPTNKLA